MFLNNKICIIEVFSVAKPYEVICKFNYNFSLFIFHSRHNKLVTEEFIATLFSLIDPLLGNESINTFQRRLVLGKQPVAR
jgi:hypothetical protein